MFQFNLKVLVFLENFFFGPTVVCSKMVGFNTTPCFDVSLTFNCLVWNVFSKVNIVQDNETSYENLLDLVFLNIFKKKFVLRFSSQFLSAFFVMFRYQGFYVFTCFAFVLILCVHLPPFLPCSRYLNYQV